MMRITYLGRKGIDLIKYHALNLSMAILLLIMIITVLNSLMRYIFNSPIPGTVTLVSDFLLLSLIWFASGPLENENGNISVDFVKSKMDDRVQSVITLIYTSAILVVFLVAFIDATKNTYSQTIEQTMTGGIISFPTYVARGLFAVGIGILCISFISNIIRSGSDLWASLGGES